MKKFVKAIALISSLTLLATAFCGCSGGKKETVSNEDVSLTYWTMMDGTTARSLSSYSEMLMYQEMEKRTGIHVDFIHPIAGSTGNEAFLTMLSSSDKPDLMEYSWTAYTGGPQAAIDDGMIVALNDYLEDYAPNYYDYMEGKKGKANDYLYKLQASSEQGNYYGFNTINLPSTRTFSGIIIRGDLLEKWGMELPETIDEWTAVFAKAKAEGIQKPFTCINQGISFINPWVTFTCAYDIGQNFYVEDGKVVFAPLQPGYKEYTAQIAEWMSKGYIDPGYITNSHDDVDGNLANGISIAAYSWISNIGKINSASEQKIPGFKLVACPYPTAKKGTPTAYQSVNGEASDNAWAISPTCGNIEKCVEWLDYLYSDEGIILKNFGVEGVTYTVEERDGETHYVYTDLISNPEKSGVSNIQQAMYKYFLPATHPGPSEHIDYLYGYYPREEQRAAMELWKGGEDRSMPHKLPPLSFTEEESREMADILEIAEAELEVAITDIILGRAGMDTYDAAIEAAKENGYTRMEEIYQASYDRYMAKLN